MFAGSVMTRTSTPASAILVRVLASLSEYSSSGNAAIRHLLMPHELGGFAASSRGPLYSLPVQDQVLEHALRDIKVNEVDPLVGPVRGLLDVPRPEQDAWYPRAVDEEAGVTRGAPGRDPRGQAGRLHSLCHRPHQIVVLRDLERDVVGPGGDLGLEPGQAPRHARDRVLQLFHHLLGRFAGIEAPVDLDLAPIRHHVRARAAMHGADREARRTEDGMRAFAQLAAGRLQLERDARGG